MNSTLRYAALPLLGASAIAAFAPLGWWPLWPLALALALRLSVELPPLRAALAGWLFGLGHFITGLYWTVISTHVYGGAPAWLGVMLCGVLSAFLALYPALVFGGLLQRTDEELRPLYDQRIIADDPPADLPGPVHMPGPVHVNVRPS